MHVAAGDGLDLRVPGDDLAEGKATLPLIYAMENGTNQQRQMIRAAIREGGLGHLAEIQQVIESTGALDYTAAKAREAADQAIRALADVPETDYKQALIALADFAVRRRT